MNLQSEATKISQTINAILNPNTSPKDRALCTEQCENYKTNTNPDDQYEISTFIIKQASCGNFDLNTLKFAIQLFHHYLINNWNIINNDNKNKIKFKLLEILNSDNENRNNVINQPNYILDSYAKCLTALALRTWPQAWDSMLIDFNNLSNISNEHSQIVLLTLTRIEEDVISIQPDTIGIIKKRRQDLAKAVALQNGDILEFVSQILINLLTNTQLANQSNQNLLITGLQAYQAYASWAQPDIIFGHQGSSRQKFLEILFQSLNLQSPDLAIHSVRTILSISSSKLHEIEKRKYLEFLKGQCFESIVRAVETHSKHSANPETISEESYEFLKLLADMVTDFGRIIIAIYEDKEQKYLNLLNDINIEQYLQVIVQLSNSKSPWIMYNLILPLVSSFSKNQKLIKETTFQNFLVYFLNNYLYPSVNLISNEKTNNGGNTDHSEIISKIYPSLQFQCDDDSQSDILLHQYKISRSGIFRTILQYSVIVEDNVFFVVLFKGFLEWFNSVNGGIDSLNLFEGAMRIYWGFGYLKNLFDII